MKEHDHFPEEKRVEVCGINITPLVLLIALGFHCVFEGIAVGLITKLNVLINLMIGISFIIPKISTIWINGTSV